MSVTQGSPTFGAAGYTLTSSRLVYDQANGPTWELRYEGLQASIETLAASLQSSGARTHVEERDGVSVLSANYVRDPNQPASSETPFDVWSIQWEEERKSIFAHPAVIREANNLDSENGISAYKTAIEEAVAAGEANPFSSNVTLYPLSQSVWNLLASGEDTYPEFRPLLRRQRSYSLTYTGTPYRVNVQGIVYTRSSLLSAFGIVDPLASRIPLDPTDALPDGFVYGWYLAQQDFKYTREKGAMKVEESLGFRWGIYNAASSGALYLLQ